MKTLIAASLLALTTTASAAADFKVTGTVTNVVGPMQSFETEMVTETVCTEQTIRNSSKTQDTIGGAIIGGVLGKVITGNDDGAAAGAIIGGVIGNDKSKPTYRVETVCNDVKRMVRKQYYIVGYDWNGFEGEFQTKDGSYYVGQRVTLNLKLTRF